MREQRVPIDDGELTVASWGGGRPEIVLLHDGLGSIAQWRGVPAAIASRTGRTVIAYDRAGHGASTPVPDGPWPADWLHREADVLIDLLDVLGSVRPLLVGHSDGGSIALIAAANGLDVAGVIALAAHSHVEQVCVDEIARMRRAPEPLLYGLARFHDAPNAVFDAWSGVWTGSEFRAWDIRPRLGSIDAPVLVVQGDADEYATDDMVRSTVEAIGPNATGILLPELGHLLHHQDSAAIVDIAVDVDRRVGQTG
jgi:pimeloyl-ACP methyl ester carboxylesterase